MSSKMLIDASHPEETRVVVLKGQRVEEFDFEAANKKQLRGNIYLAKVTRVEPSLQAAFIDYGGNRHGFLAFSEIHPDYYQIPHADRLALLEEEARAHRDEDDETRGGNSRRSRRNRREGSERASERRGPVGESVSEAESSLQGEAQPWTQEPASFEGESTDVGDSSRAFSADGGMSSDPEGMPPSEPSSEPYGEPARADDEPTGNHSGEDNAPAEHHHDHGDGDNDEHVTQEAAAIEGSDDHRIETALSESGQHAEDGPHDGEHAEDGSHEDGEDEFVEQIGGDAFEDTAQRPARARRHHYKIQEVIKRRQILLVQVVKEERGNKGAALTTYLSLAGRYSVLMPNTARGGGISRKITDADDRKRLKTIAQDLEVPEGMGIILRTAGASRSGVEVNRDFEYLLRMWESVRELTLKSTAPTLVYEEGSLIKRSIRDLYTRDVEDVIVAGEEGYREAKEFMRMLMPGAAKSVQLYRDPQPIFAKAGAEAQLDAMFSNHVTLRSGGYLVINQTEALVAIDVNSGRSTREHNIEDTALRTNLEAADEVARQLRLRDLAGLIVVDFIDMEEGRNNRAVERRIKEALKNDRARIQIGRISHFGLLEMSRQRIRTGVLEGSTVICPHCAGAGTIRSIASIALHVLRLLEDALIKDASHNFIVRTRTEVAMYILNQKRAKLTDLETRFGVSLMIAVDPTLTGMIYHAIERGDLATPTAALALPPRADLVRVDSVAPLYEDDDEIEDETAEDAASDGDGATGERDYARGDAAADGGRRRKRRRRRRGRDREGTGEVVTDGPQPSDDGLATMARIEGDFPPTGGADVPSEIMEGPSGDLSSGPEHEDAQAPSDTAPVMHAPVIDDSEEPEQPRRRRSRRGAKAESEARARQTIGVEADVGPIVSDDAVPAEDATPAPKRRRSRAKAAVQTAPADARPSPDISAAETMELPLGEALPLPVVESEAPVTMEPRDPSSPEQDNHPSEPAFIDPSVSIEAASDNELASSQPDPSLPKRSGWWQRAKATFGS